MQLKNRAKQITSIETLELVNESSLSWKIWRLSYSSCVHLEPMLISNQKEVFFYREGDRKEKRAGNLFYVKIGGKLQKNRLPISYPDS